MVEIFKLHMEFIGKLAFLSLQSITKPWYDVEPLERFGKDASQAFFNEFGLISHQIN